jgi:hypothetical protein
MGAFLFGGLDLATLAENRQIFETMQSSANVLAPQQLTTTPRMAAASLVLSYWTILIEGLVAASFLLPIRSLYKKRDWLLIGFVITTYTVIPVLGFGALLMVMGLIQTKNTLIARIYLGLLVSMPIWMPLPQGVFGLVQNLFPN